MNNTPKKLFIITLWDGQTPGSYPIIAVEQEEAEKEAIQICIAERMEESDTMPEVDSELSYEVTCAPDNEGNLYNISLFMQAGSNQQ